MTRSTAILSCCLALGVCATRTPADESEEAVRRLALSPQAEPVPALKHFLLPDTGETVHDNAATYYYKAMAFEGRDPLSDGEHQEHVDNWRQMPLDQLPLAEVGTELAVYQSMFATLRRASLCDHCQWNDGIREEGFYTLLPQIQKLRSVARVLAAKARYETAQGKFDDALATLRIGLAMARHCGEGESLIHGLVGIAIGMMMFEQVEELIGRPGSPNLYWALTALPRPLIDCRKGYASERWGLFYTFHDMRDMQSRRLSVAEANALAGKMFSVLPDLGDPQAAVTWQQRAAAAAFVTARYAADKAALIAAGRSAEEVETYPAAQVVLLRMMGEYDELRDNVVKWAFVPYGEQARVPPSEFNLNLALRQSQNILATLIPAFEHVRTAITRSERNIDRLRVLEALRLHLAAHGGQWPTTLEAIDIVPVPQDVSTGKPFAYRIEGDQAVLETSILGGNPAQRYELRVRK